MYKIEYNGIKVCIMLCDTHSYANLTIIVRTALGSPDIIMFAIKEDMTFKVVRNHNGWVNHNRSELVCVPLSKLGIQLIEFGIHGYENIGDVLFDIKEISELF